MATNFWLGTADSVAQVTTVTVGGTLAGETFTISVGGQIIATHTDTDTVIASTVAALVSAWNSSENIYATSITAVDASPDIVLTSDVLGMPFFITLNTPGGAATFVQAATTVSSGPNHYDTAANWSTGAVPVAADDVVIEDGSVNINWGLNQSAVSLESFTVRKTYTGRIGLNRRIFATTASAGTTDPSEIEYRDNYLQVDVDTTITIGEFFGAGFAAGSTRMMLDLTGTFQIMTIFDTASTSADTGLPTIRLKILNGSARVSIRNAPGGVGFAVDAPDELFTVDAILITGPASTTKVTTGNITSLNSWDQLDGDNVINNTVVTVSAITVRGGTLTTEGDFTITTAVITGGIWNQNHTAVGAEAITTLTCSGGTITTLGSSEFRAWGTVNANVGCTIKGHVGIPDITTLNEDFTGLELYTLTIT